MATLKKDHLVEKRNILNEIRANNMTLQELRFFAIYLSKINARDIGTRVVRFQMDDFKAIMELGRIDISYIKNVTNSLLSKVVNVPIEDEKGKNKGYKGFQLFKECEVSHDDSGEWYVEIDAHDRALPLMFEFKNKYFTYKLFNALRLRSTNQLRMYELLKQHEKSGFVIYSVDDLKQDLWIGLDEYQRYGDFKIYVLNACQKALLEHTDIKYTYEPYGKKGKGGKIINIKFIIMKNDLYTDQLTLEMFIDERKADEEVGGYEDDENNELTPYKTRVASLMLACFNEFTEKQILVLNGEMEKHLDEETLEDDERCFTYLRAKFRELEMRDEKNDIKNRFAYLRKLVANDARLQPANPG